MLVIKKYLVISLILICLMLISCSVLQSKNTLKSQNRIFSPLVKGLEWGMTEEEVKEALGCEDCDMQKTGDDDSKFYTITPAEKTNIYGVEAEYIIYMEEFYDITILSRIQFKVDESDIETLKEKLIKRYEGYEELPRQPFVEDEPLVWYSLEPRELNDFDEVMDFINNAYGDNLNYESWAEGYSSKPLAWCVLYEDNHEYWENTLWVYGIDISIVEYLLNE